MGCVADNINGCAGTTGSPCPGDTCQPICDTAHACTAGTCLGFAAGLPMNLGWCLQ
jgi:hypothetical protein